MIGGVGGLALLLPPRLLLPVVKVEPVVERGRVGLRLWGETVIVHRGPTPEFVQVVQHEQPIGPTMRLHFAVGDLRPDDTLRVETVLYFDGDGDEPPPSLAAGIAALTEAST